MNLKECDAIIEPVEGRGLTLQLGFMRRFDPEFMAAGERIFAGEIGEPTLIKSLTHGPGLPPVRATIFADVKRYDCRGQQSRHGLRALAHGFQSRTHLCRNGQFQGCRARCACGTFYDNMFATIKFESGALGNVSGVCPCDYGYDARVEIIGKKGIMQIGSMQGMDVIVCTNRDQGLITPIYKRWPERFAWAYINEIQHFVACVRTGEKPRVGGEDGRWAVASVLPEPHRCSKNARTTRRSHGSDQAGAVAIRGVR